MPPAVTLSCTFTIVSEHSLGVSFRSDDNGTSYGGTIAIFTPGTAGPVTTGLWDNDGNVYFSIYDINDPTLSCTINSGSVSGGWTPEILVASEAGLTCVVSAPRPSGENQYDFTLAVLRSASATPAPTPTSADG